jgi:hypothetical protein
MNITKQLNKKVMEAIQFLPDKDKEKIAALIDILIKSHLSREKEIELYNDTGLTVHEVSNFKELMEICKR